MWDQEASFGFKDKQMRNKKPKDNRNNLFFLLPGISSVCCNCGMSVNWGASLAQVTNNTQTLLIFCDAIKSYRADSCQNVPEQQNEQEYHSRLHKYSLLSIHIFKTFSLSIPLLDLLLQVTPQTHPAWRWSSCWTCSKLQQWVFF